MIHTCRHDACIVFPYIAVEVGRGPDALLQVGGLVVLGKVFVAPVMGRSKEQHNRNTMAHLR
jgi:hypothetical protein